MNAALLRAWWSARQGLDGSMAGARPAEVLARTGWIRSVGGASPYLALHARAGLGRAAVDAAVAAQEVHELPSARGCTYVLPAQHYALGLRAGQGFGDAAQIATAKKHLGVTDTELDVLCGSVMEVSSSGPLDPRALKERLGDRVRNLGAEGKKRGTTTTLPLALGRLQGLGEIRRVPLDGRLDRQRYAYMRWSPSPLVADTRTEREVATELARLYFTWIGPASLPQLQWFTGWGVGAAKQAVAPLGLVPLEPGSDQLLLPVDHEALHTFRVPAEEQVSLVSSLDGLTLLRREVGPLVDPEDAERSAAAERGLTATGALSDLPHHAILDRGRLVGFWEWDGLAGRMITKTFQPATAAIRAAIERTTAYILSDLGDVRSFSLDSPESRTERIQALSR